MLSSVNRRRRSTIRTGSPSPVLKSVLREEEILAILGAIGELSAVGCPHGRSDG